MECIHDNSAGNPNNPSLIPQRVQWGEQTRDEMSLVNVQVVPLNKADGSTLWTMESEREAEKGRERKKNAKAIVNTESSDRSPASNNANNFYPVAIR
jgi:hypothetical protein